MDAITFAVVVFFLAFPFGFWRAKSKFKSRDWMLAIHIPVVFIILLRVYNKMHFDIGFSFLSLVYNVIAFVLAQYLAGFIYKRFIKKPQ
jgi:ABC-type spermidine/putrescine transport system permease subunit I